MNCKSIRYGATGTIQTFEVPATGHYWIEAAGVRTQNKRTCSRGRFHLTQGDILRIVVGKADVPPLSSDIGQSGCSFVWQRMNDLCGDQHVMLISTGIPLSFDEVFEQMPFQADAEWRRPEDGYVTIVAATLPPPAGSTEPFPGAGIAQTYTHSPAHTRLLWPGEQARGSGEPWSGPGL
jgi:hypothetical protein